jgi:hypothetical protein
MPDADRRPRPRAVLARAAQQFYDALICPKEIVRFTETEGADWHCEPAAQSLRDERIFDWLEETLGPDA